MTEPKDVAGLQALIAKTLGEQATWRSAGASEKYLEVSMRLDALESQLARWTPRPGGERKMADYAIKTDGVHFFYETYRYDLLQDAINYSKLEQCRTGGAGVQTPAPAQIAPPDESDLMEMARWRIVHVDGKYCLGEHRYERLADALSYARLTRMLP